MDMQLVINPGSASKKYSLYENGVLLLSLRAERTADGYAYTSTIKDKEERGVLSNEEYEASLEKVLSLAHELGYVLEGRHVTSIGVRVVASGSFFNEHRRIDDEYIHRLRDAEPYAPLHIAATLHEILSAKALLPEIPIFGISDSEFHKTLPRHARTLPINQRDAELHDVFRFGYHGLSVQSVHNKALDIYGISNRTIICHLGGGISITAVKDGKSIETSMGFAPATGLLMSARTGDMDAEALLFLMQKMNMSVEDAKNYISTEGGYSALTEGVSDMRELLRLYEGGNEKATLAIRMLQHSIKKYIGSYVAILGGLDLIILTATTNERNSTARELFFGDLQHLGIEIDAEKNRTLEKGVDGLISPEGALNVAVVHTDEMGAISALTQFLVRSL